MNEKKELQDLFPAEPYRVAELSVLNWGSFAGIHTARIDPSGTLITGITGAGKSTLIDALQAILLPQNKALFNVAAAQGARDDRSLVTYVRGKFRGSDVDAKESGFKRAGANVSAVRALMTSGERRLTLMALFVLPGSSVSLADMDRTYYIAQRDLSIKDLHQISPTFDRKALRAAFDKDEQVRAYRTFSEYQRAYMDLLYMENPNAPALLCRVLGLKQINDLTALIRDLVLDPRDSITELVEKADRNFEDLKVVHAELLDQRHQFETLEALPGLQASLVEKKALRDAQEAMKAAISPYVGRRFETIWRHRVRELEIEYEGRKGELSAAKDQEESAEKAKLNAYAEYMTAGGVRVQQIDGEIDAAKRAVATIRGSAGQYQALIGRLGLDPRLDATVFDQVKLELRKTTVDREERSERLDLAFIDAKGAASAAVGQKSKLAQDIDEIRLRPDSNIALDYQRFRDRLAADTEVPASELMFYGELMAVLPVHEEWRGAIERALGRLKTTLIVPREHIRVVNAWVNRNHTGVDTRLEAYDGSSGGAEFLTEGYLRKLEWRPHRYRDWVKRKLAREDLHCVETVEILNETDFSITREGLIHYKGPSFRKNDRHKITDRSDWQLGFSNKTRLEELNARLTAMEPEIQRLNSASDKAKADRSEDAGRNLIIDQVLSLRWEEVDATAAMKRLGALSREKEQLQNGSDVLRLAKDLYDTANTGYLQAQQKRDAAVTREQQAKAQLGIASDRVTHFSALGQYEATQSALLDAHNLVGELSMDQRDHGDKIIAEERERAGTSVAKTQEAIGTLSNKAALIMGRFKAKWPVISSEWDNEVEHGIADYVNHFTVVVKEKLHDKDRRFRLLMDSRMFEQINAIRSEITAARENIRDRIDAINDVMRRTELNAGTYLCIKPIEQSFAHNVTFSTKVQGIIQMLTSEDVEARFALVSEVMAVLKKAVDPSFNGTQESRRLLDARHQFEFVADEIDKGTARVVDSWSSSSGKSGGERETFAGMIVAASLAYVLTPAGAGRPIYSTVFLDEAFSNSSEAFGRRVIQAFREMKLHLNLITPFKNINLARDAVSSIILVERERGQHDSHLAEITWEYADRIHAKQRQGAKVIPGDERLDVADA